MPVMMESIQYFNGSPSRTKWQTGEIKGKMIIKEETLLLYF